MLGVVKPLAEHQLLLFLVQFGLLLVTARVLGEVAVRLRLPSVVGELLAGFLLGPSLLGALAPGLFNSLFPAKPEQAHLLEVVSWLGVIMLLVLTGLETDVALIMRKARGAALISLGGILIPFGIGLGLGFSLPRQFVAAPDKRLVFALFIGTAMSISAIPVIAKVLMEMKIMRRDIGQVILAAGMIDDTIGWILLSVVAGLATSGHADPFTALKSVASVLFVLGLAFTLGKRGVTALMRVLDNNVGGDLVKITTLMVLTLAVGSLTAFLHLEAVLGAFIVGVLMGQVKRFDRNVRHSWEQVALGVFVPVFFAAAGLRVDLTKLFKPSVLLVAVIVLAAATVGKFVGAYAGAKASRLGRWEALSLGAGMNARGAMEIIVATIGLSLGILTTEMYSIILMVAVVTSLMAPPLLRWTLSHVEPDDEEKARLESESRREDSFVANLKRVLLPTAGGLETELAAKVVGMLVDEEDVEVTKLHIGATSNGHGERLERIDEHLEATRTLVRSEEEEPSQAILDEAKRGYDLLVIGATERRSGDDCDGPLFDPSLDEAIQSAPCPLLVVSSRGADNGNGNGDGNGNLGGLGDGPRHVLVPLSGANSDRYAAEVAFTIARKRDTVVDLVHVVSAPQLVDRKSGEKSVMNAMGIGEDLVARTAEMGRSMGATVNTDVVVGDHAENAIVERSRCADLVVLSSNRRTGSSRAFFGHRIDHVLSEVECPVVVVSAN